MTAPFATSQMLSLLMDHAGGGGAPPGGLLGSPMPGITSANLPPMTPPPAMTPPQGQNILGSIHDKIGGLLDSIRPSAPGGFEGLLSPEEIQSARPGFLQSLIGTPDAPSSADRYRGNLENMLKMKALASGMAEQKRTQASRAQIAARFPGVDTEARDDTITRLRKMYAAYLGAGDMEMVGKVGELLKSVDQPRTAHDPSSLRTPRAFVVDGKPVEGFSDGSGKFFYADGRPVVGTVEPFVPPRDNGATAADRALVQVQQPDGSVIYLPRPEAAYQNAPSPNARGSAAVMKDVAHNRTQSAIIDAALSDLDAHPDAVGLKRGVGELIPFAGNVGDAINQRADPEGVLARAGIMDIGSLKIKDRSGAAVTISEFPRLAPFVPRVSDTPAAIRTKLTRMKHFLNVETDLLAASIGRAGARPASTPKGSGSATGVKTGSKLDAYRHLLQ